MATSNCLFSPTSENPRGFSVWCALAMLSAESSNYLFARLLCLISLTDMKVNTIKIKSEEKYYNFLINDVRIGHSYTLKNDSLHNIYVDVDKLDEIFKYKISDFPESVYVLKIPFNFDENKNFDWIRGRKYVEVGFQDWIKTKAPHAYIEIQADTDNWEKPFSLIKMVDKLEKFCKEETDVNFYLADPEYVNNGFGIEIQVTDSDLPIKDLYYGVLKKFETIISVSISSLILETKQNSLTNIFHFPDDIQASCEQYLIYFSKFLEDLGINAKTSIETEAQRTLFTITPDDPTQALSQIRDALNIYLSLPDIPDVEVISRDYNDISIQQLVANVYHLKSQLVLAHSIIQAKDATIQTLSLNNFQQRQLLESAKNKKAKEEKILDGLVTVSEFDYKGFSVNIAEIFRRLKRKLK